MVEHDAVDEGRLVRVRIRVRVRARATARATARARVGGRARVRDAVDEGRLGVVEQGDAPRRRLGGHGGRAALAWQRKKRFAGSVHAAHVQCVRSAHAVYTQCSARACSVLLPYHPKPARAMAQQRLAEVGQVRHRSQRRAHRPFGVRAVHGHAFWDSRCALVPKRPGLATLTLLEYEYS